MKLTFEVTDPALIRTIGSILAGSAPIKVAAAARKMNTPANPTPSTKSLQQLHQEHGRYLAYIRHLSQRKRRLVKAHRAGHGLTSAIEYAQSLGAKPDKPPKLKPTSRKHRRKCDWCKRGFLAKQARSHFCTKRCRDAQYHASHKQDSSLPKYVPPKPHKDKGVTLLPGDSLTANHEV